MSTVQEESENENTFKNTGQQKLAVFGNRQNVDNIVESDVDRDDIEDDDSTTISSVDNNNNRLKDFTFADPAG